MSRYEYDSISNTFNKVTKSVRNVIMTVVKYFFVIVATAAGLYLLFSLLISTEEEKTLIRENNMYRRLYAELEEKEKLLGDVVDGLQIKDNGIYEQLFNSSAPSSDPVSSSGLPDRVDQLSDTYLLSYSTERMDNILGMAEQVSGNLREIMRICSEKGAGALPPMSLPLENMDYAQTGASTGKKLNPFYKVEMEHNGLDLITFEGDVVYAAADGTVSGVVRSSKGLGNVVTIDHGNGYETSYAFLTNIVVSKGQRVKKGKKLGEVGISRTSFVPHLHYEVSRNGENVDPVNYMFASVSPYEYVNMLYLSASIGQSLD